METVLEVMLAGDILFAGRIYTPVEQQYITADYIERDGKYYIPSKQNVK